MVFLASSGKSARDFTAWSWISCNMYFVIAIYVSCVLLFKYMLICVVCFYRRLELDEGLRAVVRLLLQDVDRALEGVDRLGLVGVRLVVGRLLHVAHLGGGLDVTGPCRDVLVVAGDLLGELLGRGGVAYTILYYTIAFYTLLDTILYYNILY